MTVPEYTPGEWYGVVSGDMAVLLHPATPESVVRAVWSALREREGLGRPLESLLADGITGLRPFAAVRVAGEGLHTALRGDVAIVTTRSGEQQRRSAPQVVLWTEDSDAAADRVELRADGAPERTEDQTLPVTEGVVRASRIVLDGRVRGTASEGADGSGGRPGRRRERAAEPRTPERVAAPEPSAAPRVEAEPSAAPRVEPEPVADATEVLPAVP
ncbi:hypothetical protein, partial [Cellulomonas sp. RIT-PI-Y]|uniref:hypothetical protein n=1 Tax=Cellulomonas sp. RIT-PI-Y TaxID=3035297 RepID=UPI0021DB590F